MAPRTGNTENAGTGGQRRNRNFEDSHRLLIESAVEIMSRDGVAALSVTAVARETGINRSTVYYHFDSREALVAAVKTWASEQLMTRYLRNTDRNQRMAETLGFVLDKPEVMKLWIDDLLAPGDIRNRYPEWNSLVDSVDERLKGAVQDDEDPDAEVFCVMLIVSIFIAPRIFKHSVRPELSHEAIITRFAREQHRMLKREGFPLQPAEPA